MEVVEPLPSDEDKERAVRLQFAESASEELKLNGEERRKLMKRASKGVIQMWAAIKETEEERKREVQEGRQRAKAGVQSLIKAREVERGAMATEMEVEADVESKEDGKATIVGKEKGSVVKTAKSLVEAKKRDEEEVRMEKERAKRRLKELIEARDEEREREAGVREQDVRPVEKREIVGKEKGEVVKTAKSLEELATAKKISRSSSSAHHALPPRAKDRRVEEKGEAHEEEATQSVKDTTRMFLSMNEQNFIEAGVPLRCESEPLSAQSESTEIGDRKSSGLETPNFVDVEGEDGRAELGRLLKARDEAISNLRNELKLMDAMENRSEGGTSFAEGEEERVERSESEGRVEVGGWGTPEELERKIKQALFEAEYAAKQAAKLREMHGNRGGFVQDWNGEEEGEESEEEMTLEHVMDGISAGFKWLSTKFSPAPKPKKGRKGGGQHMWPIDV